MALTKKEKEKIVKELKEKIEKQKIIIFVNFAGLNVQDFSELRRGLKSVEGEIKAAKKTLMKIALKDQGIDFEPKNLEGELAMVFGYRDEIMPAKKVWQFFQQKEKPEILAGIIDGQLIEKEKIVELAKLPSREELLARLAGSVSWPLKGLLGALQGNIRNFISIIYQCQLKVQK